MCNILSYSTIRTTCDTEASLYKQKSNIRGGAAKSLARPTSCRRAESIVSLEREACSCAELCFLVAEPERKHIRRRTLFQQHGDASSHQDFFSARQGAEDNLRPSDINIRRICPIVCHRQKLVSQV